MLLFYLGWGTWQNPTDFGFTDPKCLHGHSFTTLPLLPVRLLTSGSSGLMKTEGIGPLPLSKGSTEGLSVLGWGTTAHQSDIAQVRLMIDIFSTENSGANNVT